MRKGGRERPKLKKLIGSTPFPQMSLYNDALCPTNDCNNVGDSDGDVVSPVERLVVNWGYEPIMPR